MAEGRGGREGAESDLARLLAAADFAARKHRDQRRKSAGAPPYVNHTIAVAHLLATVGGVTDVAVLMAALLHDTLEDTDATAAELDAAFGSDVRRLVEEVSDDRRLASDERKRLQVERAALLSPRAKLVRLADKICNVRDIARTPPVGWSRERRAAYFAWTARVVERLRGSHAALEAAYDAALAEAERALAAEAESPAPR